METWTKTCGPIPGGLILTHTQLVCSQTAWLLEMAASKFMPCVISSTVPSSVPLVSLDRTRAKAGWRKVGWVGGSRGGGVGGCFSGARGGWMFLGKEPPGNNQSLAKMSPARGDSSQRLRRSGWRSGWPGCPAPGRARPRDKAKRRRARFAKRRLGCDRPKTPVTR